MRYLNLGILAHVDAGKTTLTERLLFEAGVIDTMGSVDQGSTQTDTLPLERQRGITIRSAVVSFPIGDTTVNLVDTPGHPDFIAEVERVLNVLDAAILVISAVEGVQPQTRVLMRAFQRLHLPTLMFINKCDRRGARIEWVLSRIADRLTPAIVPMGSVSGAGTRDVSMVPWAGAEMAFTARLADLLTAQDDALLADYLEHDGAIDSLRLRAELTAQTGHALVHPVFFGSAVTGAGIDALTRGIRELLPAARANPDGPVSGTVFKVEHGPAAERVAYLRMFSGVVRTRDRLRFNRGEEGKVTAIALFDRGSTVRSPALVAGQIGKLWGLGAVQIGDTIGTKRSHPEIEHFPRPTLETAVAPCLPAESHALHTALARMAEADPLINVRQDDRRGELYVSLYGEVQKEVIAATLAQEYGINVRFHETSTIHVERPVGAGEALEEIGKDGNPFLATLGIRVEPAPPDTGVHLLIEAALVSIPLFIYSSVAEFQHSLEESVRTALRQGLYGWEVIDCTVTLTACGYVSPASTARDFRLLAPLVVMTALRQAGTIVLEPIHRYHVDAPEDTVGGVLAVLAGLGAVPRASATLGSSYILEGQVPATRVHELQQRLPAATRGEGVLEYGFDCYRPASGPPPTRERWDHNPLNRKEYLLHVVRRV